MKNLFIIMLCCCHFYVLAQNNAGKMDDTDRIALTVYIPDQANGMTGAAKSNLENKLMQIITNQGLAGINNQRFIVTAQVSVLTKDITPTAPPMHAYTLAVTLYIGDGVSGTTFAAMPEITLKGVGETETKACMAALKNMKTDHPQYRKFIETGKTGIIEYYNTQCDFILKEAETLAGKNDFEAAVACLASVPRVCKDCYDKAMELVRPIFQKQIDHECTTILLEATSVWNAGQNQDAANNAGKILKRINPESKCLDDAMNLAKNIAQRVKELDQREWDFRYEKEIGMEKERMATEKERIKANRDAAVAWAIHQPQQVTYKTFW
jgi:hypothetical protein